LGTTSTQAVFRGEPGVAYRFYSAARDGVGHTESPPVVADTGTLTELRIVGCEPLPEPQAGWQVRWESATNKYYDLWVSTNLTSGFSPLATGLPATPPENVYGHESEPQPALFYLIRAAP